MDVVIARWWRYATVIAVALSGLLFVTMRERSSVERGNRLHRNGTLPKAAAIYYGRTDTDSPSPDLRYNLGTTLLELGSSTAETELVIGTQSADENVRALALYNIGVSRLYRAVAAEIGDSVRVHATVSVEANRSTLRINSEQPAAKWNLAMAQRILDSLETANRRQGMSSADEVGPSDDRLRADNTIEVEKESTSIGAPPLDGEEEALAQLLDSGPLSMADAIEILEATDLDASVILGKLLALESRARWGRQLARVGPKR